MSRAQRHQQHATQRALERFNADITPNYYQSMVKRIQEGKAEFLKRQSRRRTLWRMYVHGNDAVAVYDKRNKTVVTLMYPSANLIN